MVEIKCLFMDGTHMISLEEGNVVARNLRRTIASNRGIEENRVRILHGGNLIRDDYIFEENATVNVVTDSTPPPPPPRAQSESGRSSQQNSTTARNQQRAAATANNPNNIHQMFTTLMFDIMPSTEMPQQQPGQNSNGRFFDDLFTVNISPQQQSEARQQNPLPSGARDGGVYRSIRSVNNLLNGLQAQIARRSSQSNSNGNNQDQQQQSATPNNNSSRTTANSNTDQTNSNEEELRRFISTFGELSLLVSRVSTLTQDFYQRLNRMVPNRASTSNLQTVDLSENMFSTLHTLSHALHNISNFQLTSNGGRPEIQIAGRNDMINNLVNEATALPTTATARAAATNQTSNQDLNLNTTQMSFIVRNDRNLPCNSRHYVEGAQTHYSATNRPSAPSTAAATNDTVPSSTTSARSSSRRQPGTGTASQSLQQQQFDRFETFNFILSNLLERSPASTTYIHDALQNVSINPLLAPFRELNFSDSYIIRLITGYFDTNSESFASIMRAYESEFRFEHLSEGETIGQVATRFINERLMIRNPTTALVECLTRFFSRLSPRQNLNGQEEEMLCLLRSAIVQSYEQSPHRLEGSEFGIEVLRFLIYYLKDFRTDQEVLNNFRRSIFADSSALIANQLHQISPSPPQINNAALQINNPLQNAAQDSSRANQTVAAAAATTTPAAPTGNSRENDVPILQSIGSLVNGIFSSLPGNNENTPTVVSMHMPSPSAQTSSGVNTEIQNQIDSDAAAIAEQRRKHSGRQNMPESQAMSSLNDSAAKRQKIVQSPYFSKTDSKPPVEQLISNVLTESNNVSASTEALSQSSDVRNLIQNAIKDRALVDPNYNSEMFENIKSL